MVERDQHERGEQERGDLRDRVDDDRDREVGSGGAREHDADDPARRRCWRSRRSRGRRTPARCASWWIDGRERVDEPVGDEARADARRADQQVSAMRQRRRAGEPCLRRAVASARRGSPTRGRRSAAAPPRRPRSAVTWWPAAAPEDSARPTITMMKTHVEQQRRGVACHLRVELHDAAGRASEPARRTRPSTSSAVANSEPTIALWATTRSPARSAKITTKSSGRLPSVACSSPVAGGADALADLLGRDGHDPGHAGERRRRDQERRRASPTREVRHRRERDKRGDHGEADALDRGHRPRSLRAGAAGGADRCQWLVSTRSISPYSTACAAVKKRSRSMSRWTSSTGLPVAAA